MDESLTRAYEQVLLLLEADEKAWQRHGPHLGSAYREGASEVFEGMEAVDVRLGERSIMTLAEWIWTLAFDTFFFAVGYYFGSHREKAE